MVQESFLKIWLHREKLPAITQLQAWIYKITARECLQWLRKKNKIIQQLPADELPANESSITNPETIARQRELEAAIRTAIDQLPNIRRQIYYHNRDEGLKPAAIAQMLQMPVGTVKNHLSAAIKSIREQLTKVGYFLILLLVLTILYRIS